MSFDYSTPAIIKWKLDEFLNIIDEFENELIEKTHRKICAGNNYQTILLHICGKSILTIREILTLCANGYSDGALSLGRNLYEQMMIIAFFEMRKNDEDFQEYVDDFFLSYEVQRNKCLRDISRYVPDDSIDELEENYKNYKKQTKQHIKGDYWWARCSNFSKLIECVMDGQTDDKFCVFLGVHYARYKRACVALHANCLGNSIRVGNNSGFCVVNTSPSLFGQSTPLIYAAVSLIAIIGFVCYTFQIDESKFLKTLNELTLFYQNQEKEDFACDKMN